jgi:histidine triad (HIT) family protein
MNKKYDPNNIFARIIRNELPSKKVYEDAHVLAIEDMYKQAPVHILLLPKGEYTSFNDFTQNASADAVQYFFAKAQEIAASHGLVDSGYRIIMNHGADGMQTVPHFHLHILGKKKLGPLVVGDTYHQIDI